MKNVFLLIALLSVTAFAQSQPEPLNDANELITKLKQNSLNNKTIRADFTEDRYLAALKDPQHSSGIFYYKQYNKLRWEKTKPSSYIFISSENKVKIKESDKEKNVASFNQVTSRIKDLMITLVNGDFSNSKQFDAAYFQNAKAYIIKLKPKSKRMGNMFDYIELSFNKKSLLLDELTFFERSGDKNIMKFNNQQVNVDLSDSLFTNF